MVTTTLKTEYEHSMASQSVGLLVLQVKGTLPCCSVVSSRIFLRASHVVAAGTGAGGEVEDTVGRGVGTAGGRAELVGSVVADGETGWDVSGTGTVTASVGRGVGTPGGGAELVGSVVTDGETGRDVAGTGTVTASVSWPWCEMVGLAGSVSMKVTGGVVVITLVTAPTALGDTRDKEVE